jgi:hypothetical protein
MPDVTACHKRRYRDRVAATLALATAKRKHERRLRNEVRAYYCAGCRCWHLTSLGRNRDAVR